MSHVIWSYRLALPYVTRRTGSRHHIVRCEHFPPGMSPHAQKNLLCGALTGGPASGQPGDTSCPACHREFRAILAGLPVPGELVTCPFGCSREGGQRAVICDPEYTGHGEGSHPYATGRFSCPVCRRSFNPAR